MKVFPAEVVGAGIAECGRTEQRRRSLRARSMAYFAMGMALHSEVRRNTVPLTDPIRHRDTRLTAMADACIFYIG